MGEGGQANGARTSNHLEKKRGPSLRNIPPASSGSFCAYVAVPFYEGKVEAGGKTNAASRNSTSCRVILHNPLPTAPAGRRSIVLAARPYTASTRHPGRQQPRKVPCVVTGSLRGSLKGAIKRREYRQAAQKWDVVYPTRPTAERGSRFSRGNSGMVFHPRSEGIQHASTALANPYSPPHVPRCLPSKSVDKTGHRPTTDVRTQTGVEAMVTANRPHDMATASYIIVDSMISSTGGKCASAQSPRCYGKQLPASFSSIRFFAPPALRGRMLSGSSTNRSAQANSVPRKR